ncbi:hypothetical protein HNQ59_002591 [Chitinivorax tropicus]|uniref:DUF1854 domain-containing protein n=1 Tax=Chitinivorax tropicus TaxID=714531 RepID=A0A840MSP1_9PROT|nr:DUF1854 domain-containing protein [Chitinivorax tropicus]MBB5019293.1 hypothetical protein [Chitinivorax tropicus]
MNTSPFQLSRNPFGRLILTLPDGSRHEGVLPVRAFPIAAPEQGIALVDIDGHEVAWIDHLHDLPADTRSMMESELASREFMPEIVKLKQVSTFATPSTWEVDTTRGTTSFILKGEEDIRRLPGGTLLIADSHGVQFMIRDLFAMDRHSRKLLDRFL